MTDKARAQNSFLFSNPFLALVSLAVVATSAALLATPYYFLAIVPGLAVMFFLIVSHRPQIIYYAIIFLIPYGAFRGQIPWALAFSLVLLTAYHILVQRRSPAYLKNNLWHLFLFLFLVSLVSAFLSEYRETSYRNLFFLAVAFVFFLLNVAFLSRDAFSRVLPVVLIASISLSAFLGVVGYVFDITFFAEKIGTGYFKRSIGGSMDPNNFSLMIIFTVPLLAHYYFSTDRLMVRAGILLVAAANIAGIVTTYSRGGAMVLFVTLLMVSLVYAPRFRPRFLGFVALALTASIVLIAVLVPPSYWERQKSVVEADSDKAVSRRISYLYVAWDAFRDNPVLGSGPGTFRDIYGMTNYSLQFQQEGKTLRRFAHNTYLEILIGTGVPGLLLFLLILWRAFHDFRAAMEKFRAQGAEAMVSVTRAYLISFVSVALYLFIFSDIYHKYLLLSLALSQAALRLSERESRNEWHSLT